MLANRPPGKGPLLPPVQKADQGDRKGIAGGGGVAWGLGVDRWGVARPTAEVPVPTHGSGNSLSSGIQGKH